MEAHHFGGSQCGRESCGALADDDQITERLPHELAKFKDFAGFFKVEPRLDGYAQAPTSIPIGLDGRILFVTSQWMLQFVSDLFAGIRDVHLAEVCYRSVSEQKWITLDEVVN